MCKILAVVVAFFLWALANSTFLGRDSLPLVLMGVHIRRCLQHMYKHVIVTIQGLVSITSATYACLCTFMIV